MDADGWLLASVFALCAAGTVAGLALPDRRVPALLGWAGSLAGVAALAVAASVLWSGAVFVAPLWTVVPLGTLIVSLDRISALFLAAAAVVFIAASVFSADYLGRYVDRYSLKTLNAWYLLLFASIVLILVAGDVLLFLLAWEAMSILSYLLVNFEHRRPEASRAGYLMLAMSEAGFVAVMLVMLFLAAKAGSLELSSFRAAGAALGPAARWFVLVLTFFGFGVKAGLVPVNSWLPRAHPAAPANVSAILSGVILNLGLYGIVRVNLDLVPATGVGPGLLMLAIGTLSALVGILYATAEDDLKALLAHSSIENVGIVTAGLGAGSIFAAYGRAVPAAIAFAAALYHMVNHSTYKALLFLGAGSIDARAGTRSLDRLGGLLRVMPWTGGAVLVGALAIAALPPFNGFVSEWLTLQSLLRSAELPSIPVKIVFAVCGAGLALTAGLAVTCFLKMFAMGFLGRARSTGAARAVEARAASVAPGVGLAVLCLALGVLPTYVIPMLDPATSQLAAAGIEARASAEAGANAPAPPPGGFEARASGSGVADTSAADALVPPFFARHPAPAALPPDFAAEFHDLGAQVGHGLLPGRGLVVLHRGGAANPVVFAMSTSYMLLVLGGLLLATYLVVNVWLTRGRRLARRKRWAGGLRRLTPEMGYTATGFSNPVRVIFDAVFRPTTVEDTRETVAQHFRTAIRHEREQVHLVDRIVFRPALATTMRFARTLAAMHHGRINAYVAYVLLALAAALMLGLMIPGGV